MLTVNFPNIICPQLQPSLQGLNLGSNFNTRTIHLKFSDTATCKHCVQFSQYWQNCDLSFLRQHFTMSVVKILLTGTSTITLAGNQAPIFTQIKIASRSLSVLLECERHTSECIIMADLQQIIINKQILHMASLSKDKQFSTQSLSVNHMKRLKMSRSFCMQMGREEETEWLRRREGRKEI